MMAATRMARLVEARDSNVDRLTGPPRFKGNPSATTRESRSS